MLSAHGSAPEVVAAARANGGYVVDAVCPLVTKVHHEVKVRAGKGYTIVYVGHEGHEEAVGTMAVAPDAIHLVETVAEVDALPAVRRARSRCSPRPRCRHRDWAGVLDATRERFPELWMPGRSDLCFATTNRQSALMAIAAALRRGRGDRLGQLVEHPGAREARAPRPAARACSASTAPTSCPTTCTARSASPPARRRPRSSSRRSSPPRARATASRRCASPTRTSTSRRPRNLRDLQAAIDVAATVVARRLARRPARRSNDRAFAASDVLDGAPLLRARFPSSEAPGTVDSPRSTRYACTTRV